MVCCRWIWEISSSRVAFVARHGVNMSQQFRCKDKLLHEKYTINSVQHEHKQEKSTKHANVFKEEWRQYGHHGKIILRGQVYDTRV